MKLTPLLYVSFLVLIACEKAGPSTPPAPNPTTPTTPTVPTIDYTTKYGVSVNVVLSKTLNLPDVHPETLKIIEKSGKYHLITCFANNQTAPYDFFRSFSIDTISGGLTENTSSFLGGYIEAGFPKSPFWYEDLNNDGIKDLFIADHGKEMQSMLVNGQYPGYVCRYFVGKADGSFAKGDIADVTSTNRFYHNSAVGDFDGDGKNDLVVQNFGSEEMMLYLNGNSGLTKKSNVTINNQTGSVFIVDMDGDKQAEIISAPYIDRGNTPNTFIKKVNTNTSGFIPSNLSIVSPFGQTFGCYKIMGLKNPKDVNKTHLFYFVEAGPGQQKIFRSRTDNSNIIDEISTLQPTFNTGGTRDYLIADLNFDGFQDVFFFVNIGQNLNSRVWINNGDNTFTNPSWEIDNTLTNHFIPLTINQNSGRVKFLYYSDRPTPNTRVIDVYTKKR